MNNVRQPSIAAATALCLTWQAAALADVPGIQNHKAQMLFMSAPCTQVIDAIDHPAPGLPGLGMMTMAFGFLMGFEVAHPGIRGDSETILIRLRADCATDAAATAMDLLNGYTRD